MSASCPPPGAWPGGPNAEYPWLRVERLSERHRHVPTVHHGIQQVRQHRRPCGQRGGRQNLGHPHGAAQPSFGQRDDQTSRRIGNGSRGIETKRSWAPLFQVRAVAPSSRHQAQVLAVHVLQKRTEIPFRAGRGPG
jgi:phenylpropionate dioxygenase-like ring-hydroxylating dioxygenase large terminal subunit